MPAIAPPPCREADGAEQAAAGISFLAQNDASNALVALRAAVALGARQPAVLLNLALAEQKAGDPARAENLMRLLETTLPSWEEAPLRLAELYRATDRTPEAERAYERVLDRNPKRPEALVGLAALLLQRGEAVSAQKLLLRACGVAPSRAEAWDALGLALMMTGDAAAAETAFAEAQRLVPAALDYALRRIEAAFAAHSAEAELARLEIASLADPLDAVLLIARGALLERMGRLPEAADALEAALALQPEDRQAMALLGSVLTAANRLADAERAWRGAIALDPDNVHLGNNLAAVLMRLHRHAEARVLLTALIEREPAQPALLCNLANATLSVGLQEKAERMARQAVGLAPDAVLPWRTLCNTLPYCDGVGGVALLDTLRNCARRLPQGKSKAFRNHRDPDRRLRLGLLSGTLKTHPVGWLTVAGFEALNPAAFEIVCFAQMTADDPIARRFRALAAEWRDVGRLDDSSLAGVARDADIDVLIDLGGYGDAGRMTACAQRLAPVQIKWVGMQNHSTGVPEMDWFITDGWSTPEGFDHLYSERLLRLPDGYVCYSPPPHAPDVGASPAVANGYVTFGCFNNLAKITPAVIALWSDILRRVPRARLVLKTHQFSDRPTADRVVGTFASHGVAPGRIETRGSSQHRAFLAEYGDIDFVLDPFPYSGGLTTCEALWMGVPTLTMPGESFASRHSASHMSNVGLPDWIAPTPEAYANLAVRKSDDIDGLAALRRGLRARVKASPLCDAPRFGRNLGAALRDAWRSWCAAESVT